MRYKMHVGFLRQSTNFKFYSKNLKEKKTLATDITHMLSQACRQAHWYNITHMMGILIITTTTIIIIIIIIIITDTGNNESYYKYTVHNCIIFPSLIWQRSFILQSSGLQQTNYSLTGEYHVLVEHTLSWFYYMNCLLMPTHE